MKIHVELVVSDGHKLEDQIEIEEFKLGSLTDEEIEAAIERRIRNWVDEAITVQWEVLDD